MVRTAAQTAVLMAILTLISKLLGFAREMVLAGFFGTSYITDAYVMAQAIPNIIFAGIFGAVAVAYMPLFSKEYEQNGIEAGNRFTSEVFNILIVASFFAISVGLIFSKQLVAIVASGFTGETAVLTEYFLKVSLFYLLFTSITGIVEAFLQYKNIFLPQIIISYTQNIIVIIGIVISYYFNYYLLAYGLLAAYFIRLLLLLVFIKNAGFRYSITLKLNATARKIIAMSIPIFIGSSVIQINLFVDKTLASRLVEGSVAALNYANLIISLITGLTVTILTTIVYPKMTQAIASGNPDRLNEILGTGINIILMIAVPFSLGAMVFNHEVVTIIYQRGAFDQAATALTSSALLFYAIGLVFMSANTLIVQAYYSKYDARTPLSAGAVAVIINIVLNLALIDSMQHNGLALATSISHIFNTILLFFLMKKKHPEVIILKSSKKLFKVVFSSVISVTAAVLLYKGMCIVYASMVNLIISIALAGIVHLIFLKLLKIEEVNLLKTIFIRPKNSR